MTWSFKCLLVILMVIFIKADYPLSNDFVIPETARQISFVVKEKTYFSIRLKGNPTTGYSWIMINGQSYSGSEGIVPMNCTKDFQSITYNQERQTLGGTGFGGTVQFLYQATAASTKVYPLIFAYRRPWEDETHEAAKVITVYIKIIK